MPATSDHATSTDFEDVEPNDTTPLVTTSTSVVLSPTTAAAPFSLVKSSLVVPFLPSPPPPIQPSILPLEPGCDLCKEELAEETLTIQELQRYFLEIRQDSEVPPPDVVSDTHIPTPSVIATLTDADGYLLTTLVVPELSRLSNPLLLISESDELVRPPSSMLCMPLLAPVLKGQASSRGSPEREGVISSTK